MEKKASVYEIINVGPTSEQASIGFFGPVTLRLFEGLKHCI